MYLECTLSHNTDLADRSWYQNENKCNKMTAPAGTTHNEILNIFRSPKDRSNFDVTKLHWNVAT